MGHWRLKLTMGTALGRTTVLHQKNEVIMSSDFRYYHRILRVAALSNPPLNLTACKLRLQVPVALRAPAAG